MEVRRTLVISSMITLLSACETTSRYQHKHDSAPLRPPSTLESKDPNPKVEAPSRIGNKPYQVFGQRYTPLIAPTKFEQSGVASWYGRKFHGHKTSNGEVYNMYAMTAAHKTLPLPSYVRVTNLSNQKSAIVRVNDRGPFHGKRIIDLSYAAAYKLGVYHTGTAKVHIELVTKEELDKQRKAQQQANAKPKNKATAPKGNWFVQVIASSNKQKLENIGRQLSTSLNLKYLIENKDGIFKLRLGPMTNRDRALLIKQKLTEKGYESAFPLYSI